MLSDSIRVPAFGAGAGLPSTLSSSPVDHASLGAASRFARHVHWITQAYCGNSPSAADCSSRTTGISGLPGPMAERTRDEPGLADVCFWASGILLFREKEFIMSRADSAAGVLPRATSFSA